MLLFFQLYWDIQLLNAGMQPTPVDASIQTPAQDGLHSTAELEPWEKAHESLRLGCRDKLEVGVRSVAAVNQPM